LLVVESIPMGKDGFEGWPRLEVGCEDAATEVYHFPSYHCMD
jgi:hypothetical protein